MHKAKRVLWLLLILHFLGAGTAQSWEMPSAVGRISYGRTLAPGAAICTGVLVAPDIVLTAGHCARGAVGDPSSIRFEAGWAGGQPSVWRQGARVVLGGSEALNEDVALVWLDRPIPADEALPLPLAAPSETLLLMAGFRRDDPGQPAPPRTCRILAKHTDLLGFDCPAVSGNSGAPLLQRIDGNWQVAAVMVAASSVGSVRSWAVIPPEWVMQELAP